MAVLIKTDTEIKKMRAAGKLTGQAHNMLAKLIKPGVTTLEIDAAADDFIRRGGGTPAFYRYKGFPKHVCVSVNEEVLHGVGTALRRLKGGDVVTVDIGVCLDGYHGDAARTFFVGEPTNQAKKLVEITEKCFFDSLKFARHGGHLHEICKCIQTTAETAGFNVLREYCGHGIGADIHEDPSIPCVKPPGRGQRLTKNMCLAIEPMVTIGEPEVYVRPDKWTVATRDDKWAAHYENTVLLTDGEPEILTLV